MRIGILTAGGDCPGINAAIRGVGKTAILQYGMEVIGISSGFLGLINEEYTRLDENVLYGILTLGGTILGTSRENPFKKGNPFNSIDKPKLIRKHYAELGLDALVCIGGNGTQRTAAQLSEIGLNIVGIPKTIDNDVWGTDITFGFQSAVNIATEVIDGIHSTASSHGRVFIIEVMGHNVGWMTLHAGIAGGADVILIPEIPYDPLSVAAAVKKLSGEHKRFSIIAVAEGAKTKEEAKMSKKEYAEKIGNLPFLSVAYRLASILDKLTVQEVRCTVPGHFQRGGSPCAYDRVLTTALGGAAADWVIQKKFGVMIGMVNNEIVGIPLKDVAGKVKSVPTINPLIQSARNIGIYFGDEDLENG